MESWVEIVCQGIEPEPSAYTSIHVSERQTTWLPELARQKVVDDRWRETITKGEWTMIGLSKLFTQIKIKKKNNIILIDIQT